MRKLFILITIIFSFQLTAQNVQSFINNYQFELTNWQDVSWFSMTNTGNPIIVNQTETFFSKNNITAFSGLHFAYIGGYQNASGSYEAQLAQQFHVPYDGIATLEFHMNTLNISSDPGSIIKIIIDGNPVWSIQPYYIINTPIGYEKINVNLGFLAEGDHTFELFANENPLGGNVPMQFAFDDFVMQSISTASIDNSNESSFNMFIQHGNLVIQSNQSLNTLMNLQLIDLNGKMIYGNQIPFTNQCHIPVYEFSNGIYIVNLAYDSHIIRKKIYLSK